MILYLLSKVSFPLTAAQISQFMLDKEYTNYITLQQTIGELEEAGMIETNSNNNRTYLHITKDGQDTLTYFKSRISSPVLADMDTFLQENKFDLRNEASVHSEYYKNTAGDYEARLSVTERGSKLIELTLTVPTEDMASSICVNWQNKNQDIYKEIVRQLF